VGAYIPMLMFLVENMELIWLDQGVKTHKGLGARVIKVANFDDEKSLNFTLYAQAYHNFFICMEMCMPPGLLLLCVWDAHFLGVSKDPRFTAEWNIFLYMDIKMCQQLVNAPFSPEPGSPLYQDGYNIAVTQFLWEEECATWSAIRQRDGGGSGRVFSSKQERVYAPYLDAHPDRQHSTSSSYNIGSHGDSFRSGSLTHTPKICLQCGKPDSHYASDCDLTGIASHPEQHTIFTCKGHHFTFDLDGTTPCLRFNLEGSCSEVEAHHNAHQCMLCTTSFHGVVQCTCS